MLGIALLLWLLSCAAVTAVAFRRELVGAWREPVLTAPVLIIESDDWGYGPLEQAPALSRLAALLAAQRDADGSPAVMTLGIVLGGPDTERMRAEGCRDYRRVTLADPRLDAVRSAIAEGAKRGVFAPQLHGMEHFWPSLLLAASSHDEKIRRWLTAAAFPSTETLPPPLQSRWIDASTLPSKPLPDDDVERAAAEEVSAFRLVFAAEAEVVVPPTFIWSTAVERAWARAGVRWLVTPGRRYGGRDASGRPIAADDAIHNGGSARSGLTYLVRDRYFEPARGHNAETAMTALKEKTRCGRPTLLETHRINFIADPEQATSACTELERMLRMARDAFPKLRFLSTAELGRRYHDDLALVEHRIAPRVHCFISRLALNTRIRKLAWVTGLVVPAALLWSVTRGSRHAHGPSRSKALPSSL